MKYLTNGLKNYVNFSGRAARKAFWFYNLWILLLFIICAFIDILIGTDTMVADNGLLFTMLRVAVFLPCLSMTVRRLHDIDREGAWVLIAVIPVLGTLYLLYLCCKDSGPDNEYGVSPKYPSPVNAVEN